MTQGQKPSNKAKMKTSTQRAGGTGTSKRRGGTPSLDFARAQLQAALCDPDAHQEIPRVAKVILTNVVSEPDASGVISCWRDELGGDLLPRYHKRGGGQSNDATTPPTRPRLAS